MRERKIRPAVKGGVEELKRREKALRDKVIRSKTGLPESLFGSCRGSSPFVREPEW